MAPIYESDVAENRWKEAEWHYFEFWEDAEKRARRRRTAWIGITVVLFLILTAWPVVRERSPLWASQDVARRFALELNRLKGEAGLRRTALRIRSDANSQTFVLEQAARCDLPDSQWIPLRTISLSEWGAGETRLIPPAQALELGQPGLVDRFCYDSLSGMDLSRATSGLVGFGFAPSSDLEQGSLERSFVLLVSGETGEPQL